MLMSDRGDAHMKSVLVVFLDDLLIFGMYKLEKIICDCIVLFDD